jgi:hypothetical protein
MQRRRIKHTATLEERLAEQAKQLRRQAKLLPPGPQREETLRRARQAEMAFRINGWLTSPASRTQRP